MLSSHGGFFSSGGGEARAAAARAAARRRRTRPRPRRAAGGLLAGAARSAATRCARQGARRLTVRPAARRRGTRPSTSMTALLRAARGGRFRGGAARGGRGRARARASAACSADGNAETLRAGVNPRAAASGAGHLLVPHSDGFDDRTSRSPRPPRSASRPRHRASPFCARPRGRRRRRRRRCRSACPRTSPPTGALGGVLGGNALNPTHWLATTARAQPLGPAAASASSLEVLAALAHEPPVAPPGKSPRGRRTRRGARRRPGYSSQAITAR